jgi:hypothetical protein
MTFLEYNRLFLPQPQKDLGSKTKKQPQTNPSHQHQLTTLQITKIQSLAKNKQSSQNKQYLKKQ